jgi:hypothetical protein
VEQEETSIGRLQQHEQLAIAKQRLHKHVPMAIEADTTVEGLLEKKHATTE